MEHWLTRTEWLIGPEGLKALAHSTVLVAGLGGVGAYAAEMLARSGVGHLILVDSDVVSLTNRNRQLLALSSTIGQPKTKVAATRLKDINPDLCVDVIEAYLDEDSIPNLLDAYTPTYVVDAIDTLSPKTAFICYCMERRLPLVSAMGAGAKRDATRIRVVDIAKTFNCPLAAMLRKRLRNRGVTKGFKAVFSEELPDAKAVIPCEERNKNSQVGTISYLPAVFGCICAQAVVDGILKNSTFTNSTTQNQKE